MNKDTWAWVRKAESDWRVARNEGAAVDPARDVVSFHSQQAAEKYLKALLCELGQPISATNDLNELLILLLPHHRALASMRRMLVSLSRYSEFFYHDFSTSTRAMHAALRHAERVRLRVRTILGLPP